MNCNTRSSRRWRSPGMASAPDEGRIRVPGTHPVWSSRRPESRSPPWVSHSQHREANATQGLLPFTHPRPQPPARQPAPPRFPYPTRFPPRLGGGSGGSQCRTGGIPTAANTTRSPSAQRTTSPGPPSQTPSNLGHGATRSSDPRSESRPSLTISHNRQRCSPSKVRDNATPTASPGNRPRNIPVHATVCSTAQCMPNAKAQASTIIT